MFSYYSNRLFLSVAILCSAVCANAQFRLLVTETPNGSVGSGSWKGIQSFNIANTGGAAVQGNGIASNQLNDPAGVVFSSTGELFVGNRHGNSGAASINRFTYNSGTDTYVANGTITGNGLQGVHNLGFSSSGELFAANVSGGVSRFSFTGSTANANGTLGSGTTRDAKISGDGQWAYVTEGVSSQILRYNVSTGALVDQFTVAGSSGLHYAAWNGDDLYVAGFGTGTVHKVTFNGNGSIAGSSVVANSSTAISVAFSPDQQEMFVAGHTSGFINRFLNDNGTWVANGSIQTGVNMGSLAVAPVPEPATMAILGFGALAVLRKRKK